MVTLIMSEDEAKYLTDLLEMWAEGYDEAIPAVESDTIFESVQQYSDCVAGIKEDAVVAAALLMRIRMEQVS